jgi:hypothetical protein
VADAIDTHTLRTGRGEITPERIRTRPAVLLASILRQLDAQGDHPGLAQTFDATPPIPCGRADCDGHGWIELPNRSVGKCPECPASIRSWLPDDDMAGIDIDDEPAF